MNAPRDAKPWLPAVPVHPEPMMAWSNLERLRIEEYGRECFASGAASVKPFDPEALIRAVLPGGHSCDPQAVADDIREWDRVHAAQARGPLTEEEIGALQEGAFGSEGEEPDWLCVVAFARGVERVHGISVTATNGDPHGD